MIKGLSSIADSRKNSWYLFNGCLLLQPIICRLSGLFRLPLAFYFEIGHLLVQKRNLNLVSVVFFSEIHQ